MPAAPWQRLNPQLLRYVLAVSRGGSLSGAARQLHCVPSSISARLRQLETRPGCPLFRRDGQQWVMTAEGERLMPHARQLEQLCQQAWQSVQRFQCIWLDNQTVDDGVDAL